MTAFRFAFKEYLHALTICQRACLCWDGERYVINRFFSKNQCLKLGWEIIT